MSDRMDTVDGTTSALAEELASVAVIPGRLGFSELRAANTRRAFEWNPTGKDLGVPFAACELSGEVGEAIEAMSAALGLAMATGAICNATKKAERAKAGIAGGVADRIDLSRELADVVICADLVAMRLGIDLGAAIVEKFNLTSRERGFRTKLHGFESPTEGALRKALLVCEAQRDAMLELLSFWQRWTDARDKIVTTLKAQRDQEVEQLLSRLDQQFESEDQPWQTQAQQVEERLRSLGLADTPWCIRHEKPAQPAEQQKRDVVRGGEE